MRDSYTVADLTSIGLRLTTGQVGLLAPTEGAHVMAVSQVADPIHMANCGGACRAGIYVNERALVMPVIGQLRLLDPSLDDDEYHDWRRFPSAAVMMDSWGFYNDEGVVRRVWDLTPIGQDEAAVLEQARLTCYQGSGLDTLERYAWMQSGEWDIDPEDFGCNEEMMATMSDAEQAAYMEEAWEVYMDNLNQAAGQAAQAISQELIDTSLDLSPGLARIWRQACTTSRRAWSFMEETFSDTLFINERQVYDPWF